MRKLLAKPALEALYGRLRTNVSEFKARFGRVPKLAVVLVGADPASIIYTTRKGEACERVGMAHETHRLRPEVDPADFFALIQRLNSDDTVDGILVQRPVPAAIPERDLCLCIDPIKDVDAFHPLSPHISCTPGGIMELLSHYQIPVAGKVACVIGRSRIVGRPMASLLLDADATVIHCHSKTPELETFTRQADILVVAAGRAGLIRKKHVKEGAVVVDVGIHRNATGAVVGDVNWDDISDLASAATPVPGGVGPMTIAGLMMNTLKAAQLRQGMV